MDIASIQSAFTSLQHAAQLAKTIASASQAVEITQKIIELQGAIFDAQSSALQARAELQSLQEKIGSLEDQLKAAHSWGDQEARYVLVNPWRNAAQVYALKEASARGEAAHWLCPNCFHAKRRSILNPTQDKNLWTLLVCPECRSSMHTGYRGTNPPTYAEGYAAKS